MGILKEPTRNPKSYVKITAGKTAGQNKHIKGQAVTYFLAFKTSRNTCYELMGGRGCCRNSSAHDSAAGLVWLHGLTGFLIAELSPKRY